RMWMLWPIAASWLVKAMVNLVLAGAARHVVSKAMPRALIRRAAPDGAQVAAGDGFPPAEAPPADASLGRPRSAAHTPTTARPITRMDASPQSGAHLRGLAHIRARMATANGSPATIPNT